jgi:hypothetical protein
METVPAVSPIDILSIVLGVVGIVGTVFGVLSWMAARRTNRVYAHLFKVAEANIRHDLTEEELAAKKREVASVSDRIQQLQQKIRAEIPLAAKRAVLQDRLNAQLETLTATLSSVRHLKVELGDIPGTQDIPRELLRAVEGEIQPQYLLRERLSRIKTYLTIVTSTAAIAGAVLPRPFDRVVAPAILALALPLIIQLVRLSVRVSDRRKHELARAARVGGWIALGTVGILASAFGVLVYVADRDVPDSWSFLIVAAVGLVFSIFSFVCASRAWRRERAARASSVAPDIAT